MPIKQIYSLRDAEAVALKYFSLQLPTTPEKLKSAFRKASRETHPDLNKESGSEKAFIEMKSMYDALIDSSEFRISIFEAGSSREIIDLSLVRTTDGKFLKDLGLGRGPTVNTRPCESCDKKGYTEHEGFGYRSSICLLCSGAGKRIISTNCRSCNGSGKFTQVNSRRVVDCLTCKGSGVFRKKFEYCRGCAGTGVSRNVEASSKHFTSCYACDGTGEIVLFNPVFAKGRMTR